MMSEINQHRKTGFTCSHSSVGAEKVEPLKMRSDWWLRGWEKERGEGVKRGWFMGTGIQIEEMRPGV